MSDEIILDDVSTVGGFSTVVLNNQHTVASITDTNTYTITLADLATSSTTGGGDAVQGIYPNVLYSHENGHDDDGSAMTAYIESGFIDIDDGDHFSFVSRIITNENIHLGTN